MILLLSAVISTLVACGRQSVDLGELSAVATADFHQRFNESLYEEIWSEAADELKGGGHDAFVGLLVDLRRALGTVVGSDRRLWGIRRVYGTVNASYVEATYDTRFEKGSATELFLWKISNNRAFLAGFHLNR